VQPVEADAPRVGLGERVHGSFHLRLKALDFPHDGHARINFQRQHHRHEPEARKHGARWRADIFQHQQADEDEAATRVRQEMEFPEDLAKERAGHYSTHRRVGGLQHTKRRWRDDEADHHHAAQPDDERRQGEVPDQKHPVIIIAVRRCEGAGVDLNASTVEWITGRVLEGIARQETETVSPAALIFLLRRYGATSRDDLREALEPALDWATSELPRLACADDRAGWLSVFTEAAAISDSAVLREAAAGLVSRVRGEWRTATAVDDSMQSIAASLSAVNLCDPRELVPYAIDELERIIAAAYQPGVGMAHTIGAPAFARGGLDDQMRSAGALLTAHTLTDRLPYSMLAEELVQCARRTRWDPQRGGFLAPYASNCEAALVLCRLAALHRDAEYRAAAVVAPDADYEGDAGRTLAAQAPALGERGLDAALFGLALDEWLRLW
jgi:hypothetical protein